MAGKKHGPYGHKPRPPHVRKTEPPATRRSLAAPLWAIGIALVGYPIVRDMSAEKMERATFANASSCECAYSAAQCTRDDKQWLGPWYARNAEDRKPDDPGRGRHCPRGGHGGGFYGLAGGNSSGDGGDGVGPQTGVQQGYRGGFGGSGRVRAAGS